MQTIDEVGRGKYKCDFVLTGKSPPSNIIQHWCLQLSFLMKYNSNGRGKNDLHFQSLYYTRVCTSDWLRAQIHSWSQILKAYKVRKEAQLSWKISSESTVSWVWTWQELARISGGVLMACYQNFVCHDVKLSNHIVLTCVLASMLTEWEGNIIFQFFLLLILWLKQLATGKCTGSIIKIQALWI